MAKKRKSPKFIIEHGSLRHQTSARRFGVWLRDGLLVLKDAGNRHLAHVAITARAIWENDELLLTAKGEPDAQIRTSWAGVEREFLLAHGGQVALSRDDRLRFGEWRMRFEPEIAEEMIASFIANKRQWDMRAQYGWV